MKLVQDIFFLSSPSSQLNTRANEIYNINEWNRKEFIRIYKIDFSSRAFEFVRVGTDWKN